MSDKLKQNLIDTIAYYERTSKWEYLFERQYKPTDIAMYHSDNKKELIKEAKQISINAANRNHNILQVLKTLLEVSK